jgi:YggT family protein
MILAANLLIWAGQILESFTWLYRWIVLIAVVISWVGADPWNPIVRFFRTMVDPPCDWIRRRFPFVVVGGALDLSPIALIFGLLFLEEVVARSIIEYAFRLKMEFR